MQAKEAKNLLLRSLLFVPGHVDRYFQSALRSKADALVLDLEDSVPPKKKDAARDSLPDKLSAAAEAGFPVFVRINDAESGRLEGDVSMSIRRELTGLVLPKVREARDVRYLNASMEHVECTSGFPEEPFCVFPLVESCEAVMVTGGLVLSSHRVAGLVFGHEDFLADLQAPRTLDERALFVPRALVAMSSRAVKGLAIDTPYLDLTNLEGLYRRARQSYEIGFSGMLVLHPRQIGVANHAFSPTQEEVAEAREIVEGAGRADPDRSISFEDGRFVAPPTLIRARQTVELYKKILKREGRDIETMPNWPYEEGE